MIRRAALAIGLAVMLAHGDAAADRSAPAPRPAGTFEGFAAAPPLSVVTPPGLPPAAPAPHGVLVVAGGEDAGPAAHALAFDVYRDAQLKPRIDDATARVLAGEAPAEGASAKLKDLAEARAAAAKSPGDAASRRLFASLGSELGVELVAVVTVEGGRPVARALKPPSSTYERVEVGASIERPEPPAGDPAQPAAAAAVVVKWPGAALLFRGMLVPPIVRVDGAKVDPAPPPDAPKDRPFWKSPWFWASIGGVAAVGVTVLVLSKTTASDSATVHLSGHVGP